MDFNAASQRLVRFLCKHNFSACSNHDFPYLKYFDTHRDSRVREGGRCWSRLSLCYAYWDDCRANKG